MIPKISLIKGDITKMRIDAIVNAANSSLLGGGGVDGAIHKAGGKAILEECVAIRNRQGGCKTGEAVITTGGNLPSKYVIHTVGPVWNGGKSGEERLLANAYNNSLRLAVENRITTIAFPNISTGIYHFPKQLAAEIAITSIKDFLKANDTISEVIFVCFDDENYSIYKNLLKD
ncbi:O-acetyl-ADP-ribose deacetylase [Flavobacterium sp.]|uniref:O-acetyl-ADP-ribose deacetylase n=1 Tax=Flavobacterium sp. TaxID=239 RepID=UPI0040335F22